MIIQTLRKGPLIQKQLKYATGLHWITLRKYLTQLVNEDIIEEKQVFMRKNNTGCYAFLYSLKNWR